MRLLIPLRQAFGERLIHNTLPTLGVGEPVAMVAAAAVADAFFDASGVRMRTAPFTAARVREPKEPGQPAFPKRA